jgi:uncharacterized membrane protein
MARLFSIKPGLTLKGRKFKGLRGWAGKPFHPPLTDVPIGAFTLAAAFDVISWIIGEPEAPSATTISEPLSHSDPLALGGWELASDLYRAATLCLLAGALVAIPTAITGIWDWWKSTEKHTQAWRTANWHMTVMLTVLAASAAVGIFRLTIDVQLATSFALMAFSVVIFGLMTLGATYGGSLVYDYGFNVETAGDHPVWHKSERDVFPGEDKAID